MCVRVCVSLNKETVAINSTRSVLDLKYAYNAFGINFGLTVYLSVCLSICPPICSVCSFDNMSQICCCPRVFQHLSYLSLRELLALGLPSKRLESAFTGGC